MCNEGAFNVAPRKHLEANVQQFAVSSFIEGPIESCNFHFPLPTSSAFEFGRVRLGWVPEGDFEECPSFDTLIIYVPLVSHFLLCSQFYCTNIE